MKYIALDIGNVICDVNLHKVINCYQNYFPDIANFIELSAPAIDTGLTTFRQEIDNIHQRNFWVPSIGYEKLWDTAITPKLFTDLQPELKEFNIALLSNIGTEHAAFIRKEFPKPYNQCIQHFSCEVGARKPSKLFFQSFLMQHPEFKNCTFVDDREENLKAAKEFGFNSVRFNLKDFDDEIKAKESLKNIIKNCRETHISVLD